MNHNQEYNVGDLVEASKGENIVRGRLTEDPCAGDLSMHGWCIKPLLRDGYKVTVVEKAVPALPTEPGVYVGSLFDSLPMWLTEDGQWFTVKTRIHDPARHAPFTRLEPVADTAKKVLDQIRTKLRLPGDGKRPNGDFIITGPQLDAVAREFGVTS